MFENVLIDCSKGKILQINYARSGRMKLGRCIKEDDGKS